MNRLQQYGLIILIGAAYAILFNDYFLALIVVPIVLFIAIVLDGVKDYKQRRNEKMLDRKGMMKEVMQEANKLKTEGKAQTHKEALKMVKDTGVWAKLLQKFTTSTPAKIEEPKVEKPMKTQKSSERKFDWTFDAAEQSGATDNVPVEVANEKGREYAALVRAVLDTGTTNWSSRIEDLDMLQSEMEETVANLKRSYEEIKQERALVTHLAKLKQKQIE